MGLLHIFANGIELDYVNDTLTLKKENNAFIQDFKVTHSSFPFLIIENANTKRALGTRDITSVLKQKVVPVVVLDRGQRYTGELTIQAYLSGYRKCDLKFGSAVLQLLNKKLADALPVISIIPDETDPVPFKEEDSQLVDGYEQWPAYVYNFKGKIFPEVDFAFPQMVWENKYGDNPEEGDEWYNYGQMVNRYGSVLSLFIGNTFSTSGDIVTTSNENAVMPQLFLLGALRLAFASIGYTIAGTFVASDFARRLLLLSLKDNLCSVPISPNTENILFSSLRYEETNHITYIDDYYIYNFVPTAPGDYIFDYRVQEPLRSGGIRSSYVTSILYGPGDMPVNDFTRVYRNYNDPNILNFQGSFTITVNDDQVNTTFFVAYSHKWNVERQTPIDFVMVKKRDAKTFHMMHPTINLGRYAPEWSVSDTVNEAKKLFNLDISFDDDAKVAYFNYARDLLISGPVMNAGKSLAITEYNPPQYTGFILKYANDQDRMLYISRTGTRAYFGEYEDNENIETIQSKFKLVSQKNNTANLTTAADKEGVGLMIINPGTNGFMPLIDDDFEGRTLSFDGPNGIYANSFKTLLQFRLYGSRLEVEGPFTEHQLQSMDRYQKIAIDNQAYIILSTEFKPTLQGNYFVTLELQSITL
jgi:hypothetical protein